MSYVCLFPFVVPWVSMSDYLPLFWFGNWCLFWIIQRLYYLLIFPSCYRLWHIVYLVLPIFLGSFVLKAIAKIRLEFIFYRLKCLLQSFCSELFFFYLGMLFGRFTMLIKMWTYQLSITLLWPCQDWWHYRIRYITNYLYCIVLFIYQIDHIFFFSIILRIHYIICLYLKALFSHYDIE